MIRRAITDDALVFIACFSQRSLSRSKTFQNEELTLAIDQLRLRRPEEPWLIPVRFDECEVPDRDLGGGRTLASIQRADLFGDNYEAAAKAAGGVYSADPGAWFSAQPAGWVSQQSSHRR